MENEKLLNNLLLIIILLLVANHISNGSILEILKRYYKKFLAFQFGIGSVEYKIVYISIHSF